jgi:hypothetical protein
MTANTGLTLPYDLDYVLQAQAAAPKLIPFELLLGADLLARAWPLGQFQGHGLRQFHEVMPEAVHAPLSSVGFIGWAVGMERATFLHRAGWCVKAPVNRAAVRASEAELRILLRVLPQDRRRFAQTYALPGQLLLQRTYRFCPPWLKDLSVRGEILELQKRYGILDVHGENIGWTGDLDWVFTDWAGPTSEVWLS